MVYRVPCSCGKQFIGETKRTLETHIKDHQTTTRRGGTDKSAITEHAWAKQHHPIWNGTSVIEKAKNVDILQTKEAFYVALAKKTKSPN